MPSAFEKLFADRAPAFYGPHGTTASYTDPSGQVVATGITVAIDRELAMQAPTTIRSEGEMQTAQIMVAASGAGSLANPVKGGRFTTDGAGGSEVWTIETTPIRENGQHYCTCQRTGTDRKMTFGAGGKHG